MSGLPNSEAQMLTDLLGACIGLTILLAAAIAVIYFREREHKASTAYDAETIRSLKAQLNEASKNDHRDARGRFTPEQRDWRNV